MSPKLFTRAEVAKRKGATEAVFIIDNVVYDVTPFLDEHPGGHEVLLDEVGKDATEHFDDIGHSIDAKEYMKKFVIGEVVEAERVESKKQKINWEDTKIDGEEVSFVNSWKFPVLIGLLITLLYTYFFG